MTAANFASALAIELAYEQGFVDNPSDPGGATNLGITLETLTEWLGRPCTVNDVTALTVAAVTPIYRQRYWGAINGDALPAGLDLLMLDCAVNQGQGLAPKLLQRAVGVTQDGDIGPQTLTAVAQRNALALIPIIRTLRLNAYQRDKDWPSFRTDWTKRLNGVTATATAWATKASLAA